MAITTENREQQTFDVVNMLVKEARRNSVITKELRDRKIEDPVPSPTVDDTVQHLTMQVANRIYFNPEGVICRVLFFSEQNIPFQMRIENLQLEPDAKILRSEGFAASKPLYLEHEIGLWRRRFGMSGDLLLNPLFMMESTQRPEEIIHIGGKLTSTDDGLTIVNNPIYCSYYQSTLGGPKFTGLGINSDFEIQADESFNVLATLPDFIKIHANPFVIPTP